MSPGVHPARRGNGQTCPDVVGKKGTSEFEEGGAMRDAETIAAADAAGMAMVFTGMRHFRH